MKEITDSLSKHLSLLVIILGVILLLVGVAGEITIFNFSIKIPEALGRIGVVVVGLLLIAYGAVLAWKEQQPSAVLPPSGTTTSQPTVITTPPPTGITGPQASGQDNGAVGALVEPEKGMQEAIEYLMNHPEAKKLLIWGFSMNWVKNISSYLNGTPHKKLEVKIFIPDEQMIGKNFKTLNIEDRKAMLHMRLAEWRQLAEERMVQNVSVYCHHLIPNDMGLIIDDQFALLGTYDWEQKGNELLHTRISPTDRRYLRLTDKTKADKHLLKIFGNRFLCREFDDLGKN